MVCSSSAGTLMFIGYVPADASPTGSKHGMSQLGPRPRFDVRPSGPVAWPTLPMPHS